MTVKDTAKHTVKRPRVLAQVSVEDVSNKACMLLRLLYPAAHGRTWYGKWGYGFGRAGFNYGPDAYQAAVEAVQGAPLASVLADCEVGMGWRRVPSVPRRGRRHARVGRPVHRT
jgi:hypothetical protein